MSFILRLALFSKLFVALYVDDGLIASSDPEEAEELKHDIKITSKPASYFLGIEMDQSKFARLHIQRKYYSALA